MIAILYVSAIFLSDLLSCRSLFAAVLYLLFTAAAYCLLLLGETKREVLLKWLLSVPLCYPVLQYFWHTHFAVRSLNWVLPGYGKESAGGSFAGAMLWYFLTALCAVGLLAALSRPLKPERFERIRFWIGAGCTAAVTAAVLLLQSQFPAYEEVIARV